MPGSVPHSNRGPILFGARGGSIVWPTPTQDLANALAADVNKDTIFTANISNAGFKNYMTRNPAGMVKDIDYGIGASPAGDGETVLWFSNHRHLTNGNTYQRSQVQTAPCIAPVAHTDKPWGNTNSVYVEYARVWISNRYPLTSTNDWINFFEPHGGPYTISSAMGLMLVWSASAGTYLRMGNEPSYLGTGVPFPLGQWVQLVRAYKYEYAADGGWADLFFNLTPDLNTGWQRAKINGGYRQPLDVVRKDANGVRTEGGGWVDDPVELGGQYAKTHSKVGLYGNMDSVMYVGDHRVGRTFAATMPTGWTPAAFGGFDPDVLPTPITPA